MNEGRAVINERINLTKQAQASNQLKTRQHDFFFFSWSKSCRDGMVSLILKRRNTLKFLKMCPLERKRMPAFSTETLYAEKLEPPFTAAPSAGSRTWWREKHPRPCRPLIRSLGSDDRPWEAVSEGPRSGAAAIAPFTSSHRGRVVSPQRRQGKGEDRTAR